MRFPTILAIISAAVLSNAAPTTSDIPEIPQPGLPERNHLTNNTINKVPMIPPHGVPDRSHMAQKHINKIRDVQDAIAKPVVTLVPQTTRGVADPSATGSSKNENFKIIKEVLRIINDAGGKVCCSFTAPFECHLCSEDERPFSLKDAMEIDSD